MRHVVSFSGGVGSWAAARRVVDRYGADGVVRSLGIARFRNARSRLLHEARATMEALQEAGEALASPLPVDLKLGLAHAAMMRGLVSTAQIRNAAPGSLGELCTGCAMPPDECECPEDTDERWPCSNVWCDGGTEQQHHSHEIAWRCRPDGQGGTLPTKQHCPDCNGTGWEPTPPTESQP